MQVQRQAALVSGQAVLLDQPGQQRRQLDRGRLQPHPAGLEAGQVQHIVDELDQRTGRILRHLPALALHRVECAVAQPLQRQRDGLQRRAQLVAGAGDKQVFRLHRVQQLGLQGALGGHVHHITRPGGACAGQRPGHRLAVQPARAGAQVVKTEGLFERPLAGQAVGLGAQQQRGLRRRDALQDGLHHAAAVVQAGAQKGLDALAQVALLKLALGRDHALEHQPGQAARHVAQPLLGPGAAAHLARQAAHPPGAGGGQQQQRGGRADQHRGVTPPGKTGAEIHRHPAPVEPLTLGRRDVGQRPVDQRDQLGRLARSGKVELRRQLVHPRHLAQHAVVVAVDAQVGVQLGLDRRVGLAGGHQVHRAAAGRGVDDLDVGVFGGQKLAQRVLGGERQPLAAQAGQIPVQRRVTAGDDVIRHLQIGLGEDELFGPLGRARQQRDDLDAAVAQRIQHLRHAVKRQHVHRRAQPGRHLRGVVGGNAGLAAAGQGLVQQAETPHRTHPQHAAARQLALLLPTERQDLRQAGGRSALRVERGLQRRHR